MVDANNGVSGPDACLVELEPTSIVVPGRVREMGKFPAGKMSVVDLFAGCGGFALGVEQSGFFAPAYVNELNVHARGNYLLNQDPAYEWFAHEAYSSGDVRELTKRGGLAALARALGGIGIEQGRPDLVVGGPPCQGFSGIGHRRSYKVEREELPSNFLYKEMIAVIKGLQPRAFIFENVKGVLTGRWNDADEPRSIWRDLSRDFQALEREGYRVAADLLHAKHYGVPQNRPRLLIVGIHEDVLGQSVPRGTYDVDTGMPLDAMERGFLPTRGDRKLHDLVELLGDLDCDDYEDGPTRRYPGEPRGIQRDFRTRRDGSVMGRHVPLANQAYSRHSAHVRARFEQMHAYAGRGMPFPEALRTKKFAQRVLPKTWGANGPDFTVTSLPDDYVHFDKPRTLTVREWARLQTFPDWYRFEEGPRTTGGLRRAGNPLLGIYERELPHYTQIGNAVPVWLAEAVGKHVGAILRDGRLPRLGSLDRPQERTGRCPK